MFVTKRRTNFLLASSVLSASLLIPIAAPPQASDNTANNKQHDVTAGQQSNNASDRAITQKIRKALVADKSLSTYAHNVKIITANGAVTLKGPVKSEDEKQQVASKAAEVVDTSKIDNQLTVKAQKEASQEVKRLFFGGSTGLQARENIAILSVP